MAGNMNTLDAIQFDALVAGNLDQTVTRGFKAFDVVYNVSGNVGNNTNIQRVVGGVANNMTTAIPSGVQNTIVYTVDVITAQSTYVAGDVLRCVTSGNNALSVNVSVIPTTWIAG